MSQAILIIEDEVVLAKNIRRYLERHGFEVRTACNSEEGLREFESFRPDLVILDFHLPGANGLQVLEKLRRLDPQVKVVIITGHGGVQVAVNAMKAGARDYLSKPVALSELKIVIDHVIGQGQLESRLAYYQDKEASASGLDKIIGESAPMVEFKQQVGRLLEAERRIVGGELPTVLITGETGTGKELVARALHFDGPRHKKPFAELNCSAIPSHLIESELFGYERGAFTDARERKLGLIESAEGGTLFLDEVGDLEAGVQVKLLKLLEDRMVRRLGSVREQKVDVRFVAATNRPLEQLVRDGKFRSDLYFRLRIVSLDLPPLRNRGADILTLSEVFLGQHARRYGKRINSFSQEARQVLVAHTWPGNVRELRNVIEHAVLLSNSESVEPRHLSIGDIAPVKLLDIPGRPDIAPFPEYGRDQLENVERELIERALARSNGNVTLAARSLGISRDTLRYRLKKYPQALRN